MKGWKSPELVNYGSFRELTLTSKGKQDVGDDLAQDIGHCELNGAPGSAATCRDGPDPGGSLN